MITADIARRCVQTTHAKKQQIWDRGSTAHKFVASEIRSQADSGESEYIFTHTTKIPKRFLLMLEEDGFVCQYIDSDTIRISWK